jgi:hypothetical protein
MQEADISYFVELGEHLWCLRLEERESEKRMGGARQDFQVLLRGKESQSLDLLQQVRLFSDSSGSSGSSVSSLLRSTFFIDFLSIVNLFFVYPDTVYFFSRSNFYPPLPSPYPQQTDPGASAFTHASE